MRSVLKWAARLYPAAWRERYGNEFDALLDDLPPRFGDLWDLFRGAISMQLSTPAIYLKLGAVTAVLGAVVATGVSFSLPERYVSSAVMRVTVPAAHTPEQQQLLAAHQMAIVQQGVLSRNNLARTIADTDIYREERSRYPLEDIIQEMRSRDVLVRAIDSSSFSVSFVNTDPAKAQAVVRKLVNGFVEGNTKVPNTPGATLEVIDAASLPATPVPSGRLGIIVWGVAAGFALGMLLAFLWRRPRRWTLWMVGAGAVGFAAALGFALFAEWDALTFACCGSAAAMALAAFLMRDRTVWQPAPYLKSAAAFAVVGAIVGGFASYGFDRYYVSTAVVRATMYGQDRLPMPDTNGEAAQRLQRIQQTVLSRGSLAEMIQRPSLDLYRHARQRYPLEQVVADMRNRAIRIQAVNTPVTVFTISYEYPDRFKAQAVTREFVAKFMELMALSERELGHERYAPGSVLLEVIDPATDPQLPVRPDRLQFVLLGLMAGIPIGLLIAFLRRRPPGDARRMLRFAGAGGLAGAVIAGAISLAIPERYISTAVLRENAPAPSGSRITERMMQVLNRENIPDQDRSHLRVHTLDTGLHGQTTLFSISYEARDPEKARAMVQTLVSRFLEGPEGRAAELELLDIPSVSAEEHAPVMAAGVAGGVLLGPVAMWLRRRRTAVTPAS